MLCKLHTQLLPIHILTISFFLFFFLYFLEDNVFIIERISNIWSIILIAQEPCVGFVFKVLYLLKIERITS